MEDFSIVSDVSKNVSGKNFKKFLPFIIIGGVLGGFVLIKKTISGSSTPATTDENSVGGNLTGVMNDYANQYTEYSKQNNETMQNYVADSVSSLKDFVTSTISNQQDTIDNVISKQNDIVTTETQKVQDSIVKLTDKVTVQGDNFTNRLDSYSKAVKKEDDKKSNEVQSASTPYKQVYDTVFEVTGGTGSIYNDKQDDAVQFNSISKSVDNSKMSDKEKSTIKTQIAGLGNNGVGATAESIAQNAKNLQDPAFKASEIERTKAVIENRQKAGLDTKNQQQYLSNLLNNK